MAAGTLISRILGFVRVALVVFILGNGTRQADMLNIATSVPNSLYILFAGGALNTVLVPQIVRAIKNDDDGGEAYTNRIMTAFLMIVGVVAIVVTVGAPIITWIYSGEPWHTPALASQFASMVALAYLTLPQIFFYGVFFLFGQVLNARDRFGPMMWAPIANNIITIAVLTGYLIVWGTGDDHSGAFTSGQIWTLGIGTTLGIAVQSAVLIPYLRKVGFTFRPRFDLKGTGLGKTFSLTKWTIGFVAVNQLAFIVSTKLSTSATALSADGGAGLTVYSNAHLVWILPHSLITVSLATAMLPNASRLAAAGDLRGVAAEATKTMRLSLVALVPAAIGFVALASPIARLLFGNGQGVEDSQFVAVALAAFAVGLIPFTVQFVCLRTYYAIENTRTPFLLQCVIAAVNVAGALLFVWLVADPTFFAPALALAYSLAYVVGVLLSFRFLKRSVPDLDGKQLSLHILRLLLGAGLGGISAWFASEAILGALPESKLGPLLAVVAGLAIIGLVFVIVGKLLRVRELANMSDLVSSRFGRRKTRGDDVDRGDEDEVADPQSTIPTGSPADDLAPTQTYSPFTFHDRPVATYEHVHTTDNGSAFDPESEVETRIRPAMRFDDVKPEDVDEESAVDVPAILDEPAAPVAPLLGEAGALLSTRYTLVEPLAHRDGIESWRAQDEQLSRDVLAHILPAGDPRVPLVLDAARTGASATDSRFLRVLDAVALSDSGPIGAYIICEYSAGTSIGDLLSTQHFTPQEAAWIVRELADAMTTMHAQGLFHEQLTPANVIVTPSGAVRVVGFGVESVLSGEDRPESWSEKEAADVTALASLLYAMLSQHWPGRDAWGLSAAPIVAGALVGPRRLRVAVPEVLDRICMAALLDSPNGDAVSITTVSQLVSGLSSVVGSSDCSQSLEGRIRHGGIARSPRGAPGVSSLGTAPSPSGRALPEPANAGDDTVLFDAVTTTASGQGSAALPDDEAEEEPTGRRPLLWVVALLVALALAVVVFLVLTGGNDGTGTSPSPTSSATTDPGTTGPLTIVSGTDFDPEADGGNAEENPSQVRYVFDDDPASGWSTVQYHNRPTMGGLKPGVGIVLDLGEVHNISSVDVQFAAPGTTVELRVPAEAGVDVAPMTTQAEWTVVASQEKAEASITLTPTAATSARYVLVYVTELPEVTAARYQTEITDVAVHG